MPDWHRTETDDVLSQLDTDAEAGLSAGPQRAARLQDADTELAKVRFYLRLANDLAWLKPGQYQHAARLVAEIGRLLGGWRKSLTPPKPVDG